MPPDSSAELHRQADRMTAEWLERIQSEVVHLKTQEEIEAKLKEIAQDFRARCIGITLNAILTHDAPHP